MMDAVQLLLDQPLGFGRGYFPPAEYRLDIPRSELGPISTHQLIHAEHSGQMHQPTNCCGLFKEAHTRWHTEGKELTEFRQTFFHGPPT